MRILVAPQELKGSLAADEAAIAIASGLRAAHPEWTFDNLPLSDGGPGLLDAMRRAVKADTMAVIAHDALGRKVLARYIRIRASGEIVIEAAQANGMLHVKPHEYEPLGADTFGVGELLLDAAQQEPPRIIIGVGGSVTNDGGEGMARALGAKFFDMAGRELPPGGGALGDLEHIQWQRPAAFAGVEMVVATDVTNPLCGTSGAARVYGPQKGASPEQVDRLDAAHFRYAQVLRRHFGVDVASLPGGGAAGGLAAGLVAFLSARIASGFDVVAEATNLRSRLESADLVITGEGSFDSQSMQGKVTGRLVELAGSLGKPVAIFAGRADLHPGLDVSTLTSLEPDPARCMEHATDLLKTLAYEWALKR